MSLLSAIYSSLAADPHQRDELHQATQDYRSGIAGLQQARENIAAGIEGLIATDVHLASECARLKDEVAAIEAALREFAQ